jgi:archaellum component FlaC
MEAVLKRLEDEYRFWMVEAVKMGRGIELMEDEIQGHDLELGMDRAADLTRRLAHIRDKHEEIEGRIAGIRQRLEEIRERINTMPESGENG